MEVKKLKEQLGNRIKTFRTKKGYTQEQFCEIINLDQSNLSNIENGKTFPDMLTLHSIIKKAGIEPNYLLGYASDDGIKYTQLDYEIIDLIVKLSNDTKVKLKNIIELLK